MLAIWSLVPLLFLNPVWTSGSSWFTYCWSLAWGILSINLLVCEMSAIVWYVVVWAFFGIAFLWDWNENWPFPVLWPLLSFPNLPAYWVQHFHSIILVVGDSISLSSNFKCCRREAWCFSFIDYLLFAGFSQFLGFQNYFQDIYVFYFSYNMPKTL